MTEPTPITGKFGDRPYRDMETIDTVWDGDDPPTEEQLQRIIDKLKEDQP